VVIWELSDTGAVRRDRTLRLIGIAFALRSRPNDAARLVQHREDLLPCDTCRALSLVAVYTSSSMSMRSSRLPESTVSHRIR